jgi:hypothetical protein
LKILSGGIEIAQYGRRGGEGDGVKFDSGRDLTIVAPGRACIGPSSLHPPLLSGSFFNGAAENTTVLT